MSKCNIVCVGKNRNGTLRYWCTGHHAPASNGKGKIFEHCLAKTDPILETSENSLTIDPAEYYKKAVTVQPAIESRFAIGRMPTGTMFSHGLRNKCADLAEL